MKNMKKNELKNQILDKSEIDRVKKESAEVYILLTAPLAAATGLTASELASAFGL